MVKMVLRDVRTGEVTEVDLPDEEKPNQPTPEELLVTEREGMVCRAARMRLVLHRQGLLDTVDAIAASDPEAAIVWEYEPYFYRTDPFIAALGEAAFTPEQIDNLFRAAMSV